MYSVLLITLIAAPFNPRFYLAFRRFGPIDLVIAAAAFGIVALIIWAIARKRQNWLRWTMAFIFVINLPIGIPANLRMISSDPLNAWLSLLCTLIMGAAYYFVFTGDAIPWFQRRAETVRLS
jgi:hypothetical protein